MSFGLPLANLFCFKSARSIDQQVSNPLIVQRLQELAEVLW